MKERRQKLYLFRRSDIILIGGILIAAVIMLAIFIYRTADNDSPMLQISVNNEVVGTYRLDVDRVLTIDHDGNLSESDSEEYANRLEISGGEVHMTDADCPDQTCVHSKAIQKNGGSIVCLPHRVVLQIINAEPSGEDEQINTSPENSVSTDVEVDTVTG